MATTSHDRLALRPKEAAELLGVSPRTLWGWTDAGLIPHTKIGTGRRRTVLYPYRELRDWLTAQAQAEQAQGGAHA